MVFICHVMPGIRRRLVCLPLEKKWALYFRLMTSYNCHSVVRREPGDATAAVVGGANASSAAGCSSAW